MQGSETIALKPKPAAGSGLTNRRRQQLDRERLRMSRHPVIMAAREQITLMRGQIAALEYWLDRYGGRHS